MVDRGPRPIKLVWQIWPMIPAGMNRSERGQVVVVRGDVLPKVTADASEYRDPVIPLWARGDHLERA
jgi:hypothetical protein